MDCCQSQITEVRQFLKLDLSFLNHRSLTSFLFCFLYRLSSKFVIAQTMASKSDYGGPRVAAGRRLDPVRNQFVTINSTENMGKALGQQLVRCKKCMTCMRGKIERLNEHLRKCSRLQNDVMYS